MNVSVGPHWEDFVDISIKSGRFQSASEVVSAGLRLLEEQEAKRHDLRETLNASIEAGGHITDDALGTALDAKARELAEAHC